jgi:hypothetical protein
LLDTAQQQRIASRQIEAMTLWFSLDQIELNAMVRRFPERSRPFPPSTFVGAAATAWVRATRHRRDGSMNAHAALPERSLAVSDQASAGVEKKTAVSNS